MSLILNIRYCLLLVSAGCFFLSGCGADDDSSAIDIVKASCNWAAQSEKINWPALLELDCPKLSDYGLFSKMDGKTLSAHSKGIKYELKEALFTDHAIKDRFIFLPEDSQVELDSSVPLLMSELGVQYPIGTVITKTFSFNQVDGVQRIIETRLLIRRKDGWVGRPYVWNDEGSEAELKYGGRANIDITFVTPDNNIETIKYDVPQSSECQQCHKQDDRLMPIGPSRLRLLSTEPKLSDGAINPLLSKSIFRLNGNKVNLASVPVSERSDDPSIEARLYLDVNCAHCHNPSGFAKNTKLFLESWRPLNMAIGLCKTPIAAGVGTGGLKWVVDPGKPEASILWYRMNATSNATKMPEIGRTLVHERGVELVYDWIASLDSGLCVKN